LRKEFISKNYKKNQTEYSWDCFFFQETGKGYFDNRTIALILRIHHNMMLAFCSNFIESEEEEKNKMNKIVECGNLSEILKPEDTPVIALTTEYILSRTVLEVYSKKVFDYLKSIDKWNGVKVFFTENKGALMEKVTSSKDANNTNMTQALNILLSNGKGHSETMTMFSTLAPEYTFDINILNLHLLSVQQSD